MKFEKIGDFQEMTTKAMKKINGGDNNSDTLKTLTPKDTTHTSVATSTLISDGKGGKLNTFDHMD